MDPPAAIDATVLAEHSIRLKSADPISAAELSRWLVERQLAVKLADGRLAPTPAAVELAGAIAWLEGA